MENLPYGFEYLDGHHGGRWWKETAPRQFTVIELVDGDDRPAGMRDACLIAVHRVDLDFISPAAFRSVVTKYKNKPMPSLPGDVWVKALFNGDDYLVQEVTRNNAREGLAEMALEWG
jgi:hypothetical protein